MIQVSTQAQLQDAIFNRQAEIQVVSDFAVDTQQTISYPLLLRSAPSGTVHIISKTAGFSGSLFRVSGGGELTLYSLILDGTAAGSYLENPANRTLVQALGGSVHLGTGAVLQNNSSYQEGGGLYLSGDPSYVNTLLIDGDAVIRGCNSRTSGGGITAALRNNGDSVRLAGTAVIEQNTAANGAGVYLRSYLEDVGGSLTIGEQVQIRNNQALAYGGGIYCSSFSSGGSASLILTVEGAADISSNHAASGGGIYFYSANQGDQLILKGSVSIAENIAAESGGGVYLSAPRDSAFLLIQDALIGNNQAKNGGGVYLRTAVGGVLEITGQASLSGNEVKGAASSAGGGLWVQNASGILTAEISGALLQENRAQGNGGGLNFSNSGEGSLHISGTSICRNTAGVSGGGVYYFDYGNATGNLLMQNVTIADNTAGTAGGGLYLGSRA